MDMLERAPGLARTRRMKFIYGWYLGCLGNMGSYGCIVYERADTTLAEVWRDQRHDLSAVQKQAIVHQLVEALNSLHILGMVHADLKPQNIVKIYSKDVWKLIDFATASREGDHTHIDFTLRYTAPEVRSVYCL